MVNFTDVTIISIPVGTPVSGLTNTYEYPISSSVTLICSTTPVASGNFTWNIQGCTTCFPSDEMVQNVTENNLTPEDAGTFTCTANGGSGDDVQSASFTLRVSCKLCSWL